MPAATAADFIARSAALLWLDSVKCSIHDSFYSRKYSDEVRWDSEAARQRRRFGV
jgi:hypothetical protein